MNLHRNADELFDFKRIFGLMLGLVVLPTLLLSGFGILAIMNERAALEKRLQDTYQDRSERIEREMLAYLQTHPSARTSPNSTGTDHPDLNAANRLLEQVVKRLFPEETARFLLVPNNVPDSTDRYVYEVLRMVSSALPSVTAGELPNVRPLIRRPLSGPLQEFTLWAYTSGSDPVASTLVRNTIIYSTLMILFLALVIVGVVVTARFIFREVRLSRLQTDFVSNISHELRTPLTSIRMFIETLQLGRVQDEAERQECLNVIAEESERLTRMIERILGWARMEAGRRVYNMERISVEHLVETTLRAFQTQRINASLKFSHSVEAGLPDVFMDEEALSEAILNLLNNAVKYTGEDKRINLRAFLQRGQVAIEVADNGIGIGTADRKRIFDKFYRADALLSRKTEGSGLGLTIVRHILDAHGGKVQVESELGVGSRFTLLLPAASSFKLSTASPETVR